MTTTLRPAGPERHEDGGTLARDYTVCVNSRAVGGVELRIDPRFRTGRIDALRIEEADRRRGRGTVAALAAEEVLRYRGCTRVETSVPAGAAHGLRIATALGYTERRRTMVKDLAGDPPALPSGSQLRPTTAAEVESLLVSDREAFIAGLTGAGVPADEAAIREASAVAAAATGETARLTLESGGGPVGRLWLRTSEPGWVLFVEVDAAARGRGHGRTLLLAAEAACLAAGRPTLGLTVFTANAPALHLYTTLGYRPTTHHLSKPLP